MRPWLLVLGLAALAAGCITSPGAYTCGETADCTVRGVAGACVAADDGQRHCAFPDAACGGLRFGDTAGSVAGTCVTPDAGAPDAPAVDASSDSGPAAATGDECYQGTAIAAERSRCAATVCARMSSCCEASWTRNCVQLAELDCGLVCSNRIAFGSEDAIEVYDFTVVDGRLVGAPLPSYGPGAAPYKDVAWADFDRDQTPELVVTSFQQAGGAPDNRILRPGLTGLEVAFDLRPTLGGFNGFAAAVGDYDDDGLLDLVLAGATPVIAVFQGVRPTQPPAPPAPLLTRGPALPPGVDGYQGCGVDLGDYDHDGDDDIVFGDYAADTSAVLSRAGLELTVAARFARKGNPRGVRLADIDGDHDLDLAVAAGPYAYVLRNVVRDSRRAFESTPLWQFPATMDDGTPEGTPAEMVTMSAVVWFDADGDRDLDLAVGDCESDGDARLQVFRNDPVAGDPNGLTDLTDVHHWRSDVGQQACGLAAGDVDGDGDLDLAVARADSPNRIYLNDGAGHFTLGWEAAVTRTTWSVAMTRR